MKRVFKILLLVFIFVNCQSLFAVENERKEFDLVHEIFIRFSNEKSIIKMDNFLTTVNNKNLYKIDEIKQVGLFCKKFINNKTTRLNQCDQVIKDGDLKITKFGGRRRFDKAALTPLKIFLFEAPSSNQNLSTQYFLFFPYDFLEAFHEEPVSQIFNLERSSETRKNDEKEIEDAEEVEEITDDEWPRPSTAVGHFQFGARSVNTNVLLPTQAQNTMPQIFAPPWQDYAFYPPIPVGNQAAYQNFDAVNSYVTAENAAAFPPIATLNHVSPLSLPDPEFLFDVVSLIEIEPKIPVTNSDLNHATHVLNPVAQEKPLSPELANFVKPFFSWLTTQIELCGYSSTGEVYEVKAFGADHEEAWAVVTLKIIEGQPPETLAVKFFQEPKLRGPIGLGGMKWINVDDSYPLFIKQGMLLFSRESIPIEELKCRYLQRTDEIFTNKREEKFSIYVAIAQSRRLIEIHGDTPKFGRQFNIYISSCRVNGKEVELYQ